MVFNNGKNGKSWQARGFKNTYLVNEIMSSSPERLILKLYDIGLQGCHRKDQARVCDVLVELISSLDFDYDVAMGLFRLYHYCMYRVKMGNFDEVSQIFKELRDTWEEAITQSSGDHEGSD